MKITLTAVLLFAFAVVPPAVSQVAISASSVKDAAGHALTARLCFTPVTVSETPIGFRVGSTQVVPNEACGILTAGALASGFTLQPSPSGLYYHLYIKASNSNTVIRDMCITAITGSTWSLDSFDPNCAAITPESLIVGTVTTLSPGAGGSCTVTGDGFPFVLNCSVPQGVAGPAGPSAVSVNGSAASAAVNLNGSTPTADSGYTAVTWKKDGSGNTIAEVPTSGGGGSSTTTYASPYASNGTVTVDSNFTPVTEISGTMLTNIDIPSDLVDGGPGNSNYTSVDGTGILHGQYPGVSATNGSWVVVGGYNNEVQMHWLENVSGKTTATLNASISNVGFSNHAANVGAMVCDTVNHVMADIEIYGNAGSAPVVYIVVWQSNYNIDSLGYTECSANYPVSGFWGQYTNPPVLVAVPFNTQYVNPSNLYFRWVYYPSAIPGPVGGEWSSATIPGPGWAYWVSSDGTNWDEVGNICASGCGIAETVGAPTQFGVSYYSGNRTGWFGASIAVFKSFLVQ